MKKILALALALLASPAIAQSTIQVGPGEIVGNSTASTRNARNETVTAIFDRALSSVRGSILYRGASGWAALGPGTVGLPLVSGGAGGDPLYQVLTGPGGGTGQSAYVIGDTLYASSTTALSKLAGNVTTTKQYLSQTGSGAASAAPAWATIAGGDITGAALTKTDDTNVTLTLGGTPTTALLRAASLTLGWTGQLSLTRGGTAASLTASNGGVVYSTAAAMAILAGTANASRPLLSGSSAAPSWAAFSLPGSVTSGGIPYFSSTSAMASSALLGANQIMVGGGAGAAPTTFACATTTTVVHGGTPPTCSQVVFADIATTAVATSSEYQAATASKLVPASVIYPSEVTITYGATTTIDFATLSNGVVTLTGNITTLTLSNVTAGKAGQIRLIQDATGSRTWPAVGGNTIFKYASGALPVLSTTANAVDVLTYSCSTATFCVASLLKDVRNP